MVLGNVIMDGRKSKLFDKIYSEHKEKLLEAIKNGSVYGTEFEINGVKYKLTDGAMSEELQKKINRLLDK